MKKIIKNKLLLAFALIFSFSLCFGFASVKKASATTQTKLVGGAYVTLSDGIIVNYNVNVPEGYTNAKMVFTFLDKTYEVSKDNLTVGVNKISFDKVAPQYMASEISFSLSLTGEGKTELTETSGEPFSIKSYAENLLSKSAYELSLPLDGYEKMKTLVSDMLYYGKNAAVFAEAGDDPTTGLTLFQSSFVAPTQSDKAFTGNAFTSAGLYMGGNVGLYFNFNGDAAKITFEKNGVETPTTNVKTDENGVNQVVCDDIGALEFDVPVTAKLYAENATEPFATATYSVRSNVYSAENGGSFKQSMKNLLRSVYSYGKSANNYAATKDEFTLEKTTFEAEDTTYVTYPTKAKRSSGVVTSYSSGGACLGNFVAEDTVTIKLNSDKAEKVSLSMLAASQWIVKYGTDSKGTINEGFAYVAADMQANKVFTLSVNGVAVSLDDNVIIPGGKAAQTAGDKATFCYYADVLLGDIDLKQGENEIVLTFIEHDYVNGNSQKSLSSPIIDKFTVARGDVHKHIATGGGNKTRTHDLYNSDVVEHVCLLCGETFVVRSFEHDYVDCSGTVDSEYAVKVVSAANKTVSENAEIIGYDGGNNAPRWSENGSLFVTNVKGSGMRFNNVIEDNSQELNLFVQDYFDRSNNVSSYTVVIEFEDGTEERKVVEVSVADHLKWRFVGKYSGVNSVSLLQTEFETSQGKFLRLASVAFVPLTDSISCSSCGQKK